MKTYNELWDKFISYENFDLAVKNSQKHKKNRRAVIEFNKNREDNILKLIELVKSGNFRTSVYTMKTIFEPKKREIYKLPYYPDRIVQHAVMNILKPILLPKFIENSFACIEGRGQHKACDKCYQFVQKYQFCLKCDIRKFYPSIDQFVLSQMFHKLIKDVKFMQVVDAIIFSFQGGKNCPIGNYCSQWFGNFYLTLLDNFVYHVLKCHAYVRYCDDFMLFSDDKQFLGYCKRRIGEFLEEVLLLNFSKAELFNVQQGVDFCGYRSFRSYRLIRKSTALRIRRRCKSIEQSLSNTNLSQQTLMHFNGQVASAHGVLICANSRKFRKSIKLDIINKKVCFLLGVFYGKESNII